MKTALVLVYLIGISAFAFFGRPIVMRHIPIQQKESVKHFSTKEIDAVWLKTGYLSHDLKFSGVGYLRSFETFIDNKVSMVKIEQSLVCERFQHENVVIYIDDKRAFAVPHFLNRQIFMGPRTLLQRIFLRFHVDGNDSKQQHFYVVIDNGNVYCTEISSIEQDLKPKLLQTN